MALNCERYTIHDSRLGVFALNMIEVHEEKSHDLATIFPYVGVVCKYLQYCVMLKSVNKFKKYIFYSEQVNDI